ncbi:MAG: transcriptional repressor [Deltaproteobacteria bacterium]|nr:transcriptional repressor [Deltaproteobacteria bacterium]
MPRNTEPRRALREVLDHAPAPLTIEQILLAARAFSPRIGIATVYRNLKLELAAGGVRRVEIPGEPVRFEIVRDESPFRFVCESCRNVFNLGGGDRDVDDLLPEGFLPRRFEVFVYGLCDACWLAAERDRRGEVGNRSGRDVSNREKTEI